MELFAKVPAGWFSENLFIEVVIFAGIVAVALVALRAMKFQPPDWAVAIFWILVIVVVAVFAIRFLGSL